MYVYKITNLINGKMYIGMHNGNKPGYMGSGKLLRQAIDKYGIENFNKEVLEECESHEQLIEAESRWIKLENAVESSMYYNLMEGGHGGDTGFNSGTCMKEVIQSVWDSYDDEQREERLKSNWNKFQGRDKSGSKNPRAKEAIVNGKRYSCLKDALQDFPHVSYSALRRAAQSGVYDEKRKIKAEYAKF